MKKETKSWLPSLSPARSRSNRNWAKGYESFRAEQGGYHLPSGHGAQIEGQKKLDPVAVGETWIQVIPGKQPGAHAAEAPGRMTFHSTALIP